MAFTQHWSVLLYKDMLCIALINVAKKKKMDEWFNENEWTKKGT